MAAIICGEHKSVRLKVYLSFLNWHSKYWSSLLSGMENHVLCQVMRYDVPLTPEILQGQSFLVNIVK